MRVLIVDDEPIILRMLKRVLSPHALVTTAGGLDEALAALEGERFDVVLADDGLGAEGVGERLLAEVRVRQPSARRILMSGHAGPEMNARALRGAAEAFLPKTFDCETLLAAVGLDATAALPTGTGRG